MKALMFTKNFIEDYMGRHAHPVNAILHLIGVPLVLYGLYLLFGLKITEAVACIFVGYLLQYVGHRCQGNEVGEVMLIKSIMRRLHQGRPK